MDKQKKNLAAVMDAVAAAGFKPVSGGGSTKPEPKEYPREGVAAFLMHCADLALSAHVGTSYDTVHLTRDEYGTKVPQYVCRVRSIKGSVILRVCIRESGHTPWSACGRAKEKLDKIQADIEERKKPNAKP